MEIGAEFIVDIYQYWYSGSVFVSILLSLLHHLSFSVFQKYIEDSPKYWDCPCSGGMPDVIEETVFLYRNVEIFKTEYNQILNHVALIINAVWH